MVKAIFGLSGDPITYGHVDVVEQALKDFDELVVAIGDNIDKSPDFYRHRGPSSCLDENCTKNLAYDLGELVSAIQQGQLFPFGCPLRSVPTKRKALSPDAAEEASS